jgi:hypothetical protein
MRFSSAALFGRLIYNAPRVCRRSHDLVCQRCR